MSKKSIIYVLFLFLVSALTAQAANKDIIVTDPTGGAFRGIIDTNKNTTQFNFCEPKVNVYSADKYFAPLSFKTKKQLTTQLLGNSFNVLSTLSKTNLLFPAEFFALKVNANSSTLHYYSIDYQLDSKCNQAINIAPKWMRNDLLLKFRELRKKKSGYDAIYAQIILDAAKENTKYVDEVAFLVSHTPIEILSRSDIISNNDMKNYIADVKHIYNVADSLKYVRIVEHGDYSTGDYYTTTEYRYKPSPSASPVWGAIPYEIYYWYVVHPQIYQELIQYTDNPSFTEQRTWGYSWREFYWSNPDPAHNYMPVNQKNKIGEVVSIPRLGELMQNPEILFDRKYDLLHFGRAFNETTNTALNVLGNWCSRAVPGDPSDNNYRPIAPNQVLTHHRGRCGEDTQVLVAAARTCLIPIIARITHCEDHVFGAVYDIDRWQHFEFFRGGLAQSGWGWTHLSKSSTYEELAPDYWIISTINGMRPDGYAYNHTSVSNDPYTKTCELVFTVKDANGRPIDGAMINLHGVPYWRDTVFNSVQYTYSFSAFTDKNGVARITAGDGKTYLYKIYHSGFTNGQYPKDTLSFNIAVGKVYAGKLIGKSEAGKVYEQNIVISDYKIPDYNITKNNYIESTKYALEINMKANDILMSQNNGRTFAYWNPDSAGYMKYFVVDQNNFDKLQNGQAFEVYSEFNYQDNGTIQIPIPNNSTDWFVVCSNRLSTRQAQLVEFEANLIEGDFSYSSVESEFVKNCSFYPNPFNSYCKISVPSGASLVEIIDINGNTLFSTTETEFNWTPDNTINQGVYFVRAKINNRYYIDKIIYNK